SLARAAMRSGACLVVPDANLPEATLTGVTRVVGATTLAQVVVGLRTHGADLWSHADAWRDGASVRGDGGLGGGAASPASAAAATHPTLDFADVAGQVMAKRALEIAAAGGHNVLMMGPPGTGKTMLARRLPGILPPLSEEELLEVVAIHSVGGLIVPGT